MRSKVFARGIVGAAAMAGVLTLAERATGADYDYGGPSPDFIQTPHQDKVEFASNWYVRGDLAYAAETFPKISSGFTFDPSIYPAFTFGPSSSVLNTFSAGAGMGYKVNNWFRTDLVLDYRSTVQAGWNGPSITCTTGLTTLPSGQVVVSAQVPAPAILIPKFIAGICSPMVMSISGHGAASPLCWGWRWRHLGADQAVGQLDHEQ